MVSKVVSHMISSYPVINWCIKYLLRDMDVSDLCVSQHLSLTTHQLLEEVNGGVIIRWKKDTYLTCEEVIDLPLAAVLSTELLRIHPNSSRLVIFDALVSLVVIVKCRTLCMVHVLLKFLSRFLD